MIVAAVAPSAARADSRELYTLFGYQGGVSHYRLSEAGDGTATSYSGAIDLTVYYGLRNAFGLRNALHVGGRLRLASTSGVLFSGADVTNPDGTRSQSDIHVDHRAIGVGGVIAYRVDNGYALAPVLEVGCGLAVHQVRNVVQVPQGGTVGTQLEGSSDVVVYGSGGMLLEYRWRDRWLASAGVMVQAETAGPTPWSFSVPVRIGYIFW
jgi:hypothetical protein